MTAHDTVKTSNAALAEALARGGVPVFPCHAGGPSVKRPHTKHGFKDASADPATVEAWWQTWPNALPAIPTGAASGLAVLDGDVDNETGDALGADEIAALGLHLAGAVEVCTASGGMHLWYRHAPGTRCSTRQVADHVDERGEGGYAIAPGAVLADGRRYTYKDRSLTAAFRDGDLPAYPLDATAAAKAARKAAKSAGKADDAGSGFGFDTGTEGRAEAFAQGGGDPFFAAVKAAALSNLDAWVPKIFPEARHQPGTGAWRVSSEVLGRALEEDLSLHPEGIQDFGEETALTAIDVVMRWGDPKTPLAAAEWLCEALGLDPDALGRGGRSSPKADSPDGLPAGFRLTPSGVYRLKERDDGESEAVWLCSPLRVLALPSDKAGRGWGRWVEVIDPDGTPHRAAIPASLFSGDGQAVRATLLDLGLQMASGRAARDGLGDLLMQWRPKARAVTSDRLGWSDETCRAFVLGDGRVLGASNVVFQNEHAPEAAAEMKAAGSPEGWRESVAALCTGNPILVAAVSLAFSGPLLEPLGLEGGGLHLRGESSRGKTSALRAAASVWGSPRFVQPWRATSNGLEGVAVACNSSLLPLDEMGEIDPHEAGKSAYMLANGTGKARATRSGLARPAARWRVPVLSSGEISLADKLAEAGKRAKAGQSVRLLDIPADARAHGAFDEIHGHAGGAEFSDAVKLATAAHYGHAGPAFVARFLEDSETVLAQVREASEGFAGLTKSRFDLGSDGQIKRALARLGMVAAAGEMATAFGLTGWRAGEARDALLTVFGLWLDARGGGGASEAREAVERTRDFLTLHGESRFEPIPNALDTLPVRDRAGWRANGVFYISTGAWREIHKGADPARAARHVLSEGLLEKGDGRNLTVRVPREVQGRPRAYAVRSEILGGGDD